MTTAAIQANLNPDFVTRHEFMEFKGEFYDFRDEVYTRFDDVYVYVDKRFKEQRKEIGEDMDRRFSDQERRINENMDRRFEQQRIEIRNELTLRFREQSKEHAQMNGAFYEKIHDEIKTALEYMQLYVEAKLADKKS